ncbi:hypothetical protein RYX36_002158 [Vicia faba]
MAPLFFKVTLSIVVLLASLLFIPISCSHVFTPIQTFSDVDLLEFPLNLEYLEAELFLYGTLGHGLDEVAPELAEGGPPPIGAKLAILGPLVKDIIFQFGMQEVGHLRNKLGKEGIKDKGLVVNSSYPGNILAGDEYSLSYPRTPKEILSIVYGSGNESVPGGFYPHGGDGHIARSYLP